MRFGGLLGVPRLLLFELMKKPEPEAFRTGVAEQDDHKKGGAAEIPNGDFRDQ